MGRKDKGISFSLCKLEVLEKLLKIFVHLFLLKIVIQIHSTKLERHGKANKNYSYC